MAKGSGFAVCTMKKQTGSGGGLSAHIDREVYDPLQNKMIPFRPASVRDDSRTALNRECIESAVKVGRTQSIWNRLREAGFSRKKDDGEDEKRKTRKIKDNAVIALCFVCTSDEETMKKLEEEGRIDAWIKKSIEWFQKEFGRKNVVSAVLHMDETTPHLHITVVPITTKETKERKEKPKFDENGKPIKKYETDKEGNIILDEKGRAIVKKRNYKKQEVTARLSAKDLCNPLSMNRWQTEYAEAMKEFGMKRGIVGSKQKNVPPAEWNLQQVNGQLMAVEKEVHEQEATKKANAATIENQEIVIALNKATIERQDNVIADNGNTIQEQNTTIQDNNHIITNQLDAISDTKKEVRSMEKSSLFDKLKRHGLNSDVRRAIEEEERRHQVELSQAESRHQEELAKARMATCENGKPISWKNGGQLTWEEYARFMEKQKKEKKAIADKEKADALLKAKQEFDAKIRELKSQQKKEIDEVNTLLEKTKQISETINKQRKLLSEKEKELKELRSKNKAMERLLETIGLSIPIIKDAYDAILSLATTVAKKFTPAQITIVDKAIGLAKAPEQRVAIAQWLLNQVWESVKGSSTYSAWFRKNAYPETMTIANGEETRESRNRTIQRKP